MFLLVPAHLGSPGQMAVKRSLLLCVGITLQLMRLAGKNVSKITYFVSSENSEMLVVSLVLSVIESLLDFGLCGAELSQFRPVLKNPLREIVGDCLSETILRHGFLSCHLTNAVTALDECDPHCS